MVWTNWICISKVSCISEIRKWKMRIEQKKMERATPAEQPTRGPASLPRAAAQHWPGTPSAQPTFSLSLTRWPHLSAPSSSPSPNHAASSRSRDSLPGDCSPLRPLNSASSTAISSPTSPLSPAPKTLAWAPPGCPHFTAAAHHCRRQILHTPVVCSDPEHSCHLLSLYFSLANLFDMVLHLFVPQILGFILDRRRPPPYPSPTSNCGRKREAIGVRHLATGLVSTTGFAWYDSRFPVYYLFTRTRHAAASPPHVLSQARVPARFTGGLC